MSKYAGCGGLTPLELARKLGLHSVGKYLLEAVAKEKEVLDPYPLPVRSALEEPSLSHALYPVPTNRRSELKLQKRQGFRAMFGRARNN